MFAIGVPTYGGPNALHEIDVEPETLGDTDVRLKVLAAAVNPTDTLLRSGARADTKQAPAPGVVPGMDAAGVVIEIGAAVTEYKVGDYVIGIVLPSGTHGAYRSDLVLPVSSITKAPNNASEHEASTLPMNGLTARLALDKMQLKKGQTLAVTGAAGAFGGYVVQLAKLEGLTVVVDAAPADVELMKSLGADVILERSDDFAGTVREHFPDGVDGLADGADLKADALPAVKDGGAVATVRGYAGDGSRELEVTPVMVRDYGHESAKLATLRDLVEQNKLTLRVAEVMPANRASEAHRRLEAGGVRGRLVLSFA